MGRRTTFCCLTSSAAATQLQVEDSEVVDSDGRVREDGPRIDEFDRFSRVEHATVSYPIEFCRHRVDVVDSPGLGEHETRTRRVLGFLSQADAVVLVLDATQLLTQEETHFLESVLLGLGLRNIFFVINRWNVLESQFLNPGERAKQVESLNHRIERRCGRSAWWTGATSQPAGSSASTLCEVR